MNESGAILKGPNSKRDASHKGPARAASKDSNQPVKSPAADFGPLRDAIHNVRRNEQTPSIDSISEELISMSQEDRTSTLQALQQTHGNRYVQKLVSRTVPRSGEYPAGMLSPGLTKSALQQSFALTGSGILQRKCDKCQEDEKLLRRKAIDSAPEMAPPVVHEGLQSPGASLVAATREFMEPRFRHGLSRVPVYSKSPANIQAKLTINTPGDIYEQEADRIADQVTATPANTAISGASAHIQRFSGQSNRQVDVVPASVDRVLTSPGRPLDPLLQQEMEQRFGHDFSHVRVHSGSAAEQSARDVNAHAYTVGQDMVFGTGRFSPGTHEGRRLIAHELTHTVQQLGRGIAVARKDNNAPDQERSFGAILSDFNWQRYNGGSMGMGDAEKAKPFARQLMKVPATSKELLDNAISIAIWAQEHGLPEVRDNMLAKAEGAWRTEFKKGGVLPAGGESSFSYGPENLVQTAKKAARADDHVAAFSLFGHAHLFYSFQILQLTEERFKALEKGQKWPAGVIFYPDAQHVYDELRDIYSFYFQLESEARNAGNAKRAAEMRARAKDLRAELKDKWSFSGLSMIAEVSEVETLRGPGLKLHGANQAETDLTALPGLPPPAEVGNNLQAEDLGRVQQALGLQSDFLAEVVRVSEVQKEFKGKSIDKDVMNDLGQRLRIWKAMYISFKRSGPGALARLMGLIGRHLKAFTKHTEYNVRDWGTSYLDSEMPTDLAGRAERDCGVYALMVAWETFKTLKDSDPGAKVSFKLVALLDHVILFIEDQATNEYYEVNNDEVTGPNKGDPRDQIGRAWARVSGHVFTVGPAMEVPVGSTADSSAGFKKDLWNQYLKNVNLRLRAKLPDVIIKELEALKKSDPIAYDQRIAEIKTITYEKFYADEQQLDERLQGMDAKLNQIVNSAVPDNALKKEMPTLGPEAVALQELFLSLAPETGLQVDPKGKAFGIFSLTDKSHPLARAAMAMLRFQKLTGTLAPDQQVLIKFCDLITPFHNSLEDFRKKNMPPNF